MSGILADKNQHRSRQQSRSDFRVPVLPFPVGRVTAARCQTGTSCRLRCRQSRHDLILVKSRVEKQPIFRAEERQRTSFPERIAHQPEQTLL